VKRRVVVGMEVGVFVKVDVGMIAVLVVTGVWLGIGKGMGVDVDGVNSEEAILGITVISLTFGYSSISRLGEV
jgi:hypothetical protein